MLKDATNRRLRLYFGVLFNMVFLDVLKLIFAVFVAFLFGKLVSKLKLPAILGWLLAGMTLGPHALGLLNEPMMEAAWYTTAESILECVVGLMIGTELIWRKIKKAGKQIVVTTITESLGTFLVVSLVFGVIFGITGVTLSGHWCSLRLLRLFRLTFRRQGFRFWACCFLSFSLCS